VSKITGDGNGSVDPTDLEHRMKWLERAMTELARRNAIYERRILILEGKRAVGRADDALEWDNGVTPQSDARDVTGDAERGVGRNSHAERQRRYREKQKQLPPA
jgi:hypothetical protein